LSADTHTQTQVMHRHTNNLPCFGGSSSKAIQLSGVNICKTLLEVIWAWVLPCLL